ncbi:MAG: 4-hydroxy-tetrahydrodipicolinate reductase [Candidatus Cloacimonetes bacterium]|nr:4-hydroxy-tetrahydrodipicolinate reductase [Candidatus Cloacimonadota bacterium]
MLRLGLIGYGKMGKMIAQLAESKGCRVVAIIDPEDPQYPSRINPEALKDVDVCLEFTHPDAVIDNVTQLAALHKKIVIGTTGWNDRLEEVRQLATRHQTGIIYAANFSMGMNLFNRIVAYATQLMDKFPEYDVWGMEMHHNQKADSPSGTAIQLANTVLAHHSGKTQAVYDTLYRRIQPHELHFASIRGGSVPGLHEVGYDSQADSITLAHNVRDRACLALGALEAALWIHEKQGFYSFNEMMDARLC